jgi:hypothetical protein
MKIHRDHLVDHLRLAIRLLVEGSTHAQGDASHLEEVAPHMASEHRVSVTDDGRRKPVQPDNAIEEGTDDGGRSVGVAKGDEMRVHGEAVDHREYDGFPANLGQTLDEVHGDIRPHLGRNVEGLQQAGGLQRLGLVPLASVARPHPILDKGTLLKSPDPKNVYLSSTSSREGWEPGS